MAFVAGFRFCRAVDAEKVIFAIESDYGATAGTMPTITWSVNHENDFSQVEPVDRVSIENEPRKPVGPRIPRISRLMALAIKMQGMVDRGEVPDYAELARLAQVTRARMTQIMDLNLLSPQLQEWLLFLEPVEGGRYSIRLMGLQAVCLETDWGRQPSLTNY